MSLTEEQVDAIQELVNIGVGRAAKTLNEMLSSHIHLQVPYTKVLTLDTVQNELKGRLGQDPISSVKLSFTGSFSGTAQLVFPTDSASSLVAALTGEELGTPDLDAVKIGTLSEVGNIVINGVMGSIANVLHQHLDYAIPLYLEDQVEQLLTVTGDTNNIKVIFAQARFTIEQLQITGDIILVFSVASFDTLLTALSLYPSSLI